MDSQDVREEEWEPWLQLLTILNPHQSWNSFCKALIENLEPLTGAQRISVLVRSGGEFTGWPVGSPLSSSVLPEQVGHVAVAGGITCTMAYHGPDLAAWLVFEEAGRWNLEQILRRVAGPIGQLLARVRAFEETRISMERALPPVEAGSDELVAVRKEELGELLLAGSAASRTATFAVIREAADRLEVCWLDPDDGVKSVAPEDIDIVVRLDDALSNGVEVSLRESVALQLGRALGGGFSELDWFYFVPVRTNGSIAALVGAGLATAAAPFNSDSAASALNLGVAAFPQASGKRIRQATLLQQLRLIADELGTRLAESHSRELALTDGMMRERAHLGIDLHDSILQDLTYLQLQLGRLDQVIENEPEGAKALLSQVQSQLQTTSREARELAVGLTANAASSDLRELLEPVVDRFRSRFDGRVDFRTTGIPRQSPPSVNSQTTRILQEVLNNVWKHAAASRVSVELGYEAENIRVAIVDNGRGFVMEERSSGQLGLRGINERAQEIGATIDVNSEPTKGTTVTVRVPA